MLTHQRALFDIPREVCYLSAASYSPLPLAVQAAGHRGVMSKGRPWQVSKAYRDGQFLRARTAAARLINADPDDVALVASVAYGFATAAKLLAVEPGQRVLVLQDDHSSPVLAWHEWAEAGGFEVETVKQPADHDWTSALLEAIDRPGAPPVAVASISNVHWADGCMVDLAPVSRALKARGAALALDATQAAGVIPMDVNAFDPDFVMFPTYKWLLGPYGRAFLYVAKRHQGGAPIEQTTAARKHVRSEDLVYFTDLDYIDGAERFDMGERDYFVTMEMASVGMELVAEWGAAAISERLRAVTDAMAAQFPELAVPDRRFRAPHLLSFAVAPERASQMCDALAEKNVHVTARLGRVRVAPHVYNDDADIETFVSQFKSVL